MAQQLGIIQKGDKRFRLAGGSLVRTMDIGSDWNVLLIGVRLTIEGSGSIVSPDIGNPSFFMGVGSGNSAHYESSDGHFYGIKDNESTTFPLATSGADNYYGTIDCRLMKKEGATETLGNDQPDIFISAEQDSTSALFLRFVRRASGVVQILFYAPSSTGSIVNIDRDEFWNLMSTEEVWKLANFTTKNSGSINYYQGLDRTMSGLDEATYGYLDSVMLYWKPLAYPMEIADFGYSVISNI